MSEYIDAQNFKALSRMDPKEVIQRTGCDYSDKTKTYRIEVWQQVYEVCPTQGRIETDDSSKFHGYFDLFVLYYLISVQSVKPSGQWVSPKDVTGGAAFFRGPHTIPTHRIVESVGQNIDQFHERCKSLDGVPVQMGDAAYRFDITDRLPVTVIYWLGDEDFSSEASLLFDSTIETHLPLDIIYALAVSICEKLAAD